MERSFASWVTLDVHRVLEWVWIGLMAVLTPQSASSLLKSLDPKILKPPEGSRKDSSQT